MSFYLQTIDDKFWEWHIQSPKPKLSKELFSNQTIYLLQADGDELDLIRARFDNIPITKGNICIWHGAMADFIFNNLRM